MNNNFSRTPGFEPLEYRRLLSATPVDYPDALGPIASEVGSAVAGAVPRELQQTMGMTGEGESSNIPIIRPGRMDVNRDGFVTPNDVLQIINELNRNGPGPVTRVNESPVAQDTAVEIAQGQQAQVVLTGITSDAECDAVQFTVGQHPQDVDVEIANNVITITPDPGIAGEFLVEYIATDSAGNADSGIITVTVTPNEAPFVFDLPFQTDKDVPLQFSIPSGDPDGDAVTVDLDLTRPALHGVVTSQDGSYVYTPEKSFVGTDTFGYTATDGKTRAFGSVTVTVVGEPDAPNEPPTAENDRQLNGTSGIPLVFNIGASDPEGDPLTYVISYAPQNGAVNVNSDGEVTYTSVPGFTGTDVMLIDVRDGTNIITLRYFINVSAAEGEGEGQLSLDDWLQGVDGVMNELGTGL
jgi:large repetitive protein